MADTTFTPNDDLTPEPTAKDAAKGHFAKAVEEAKAGASALGKEAQERAGEVREKISKQKEDLSAKSREKGSEAKDMAYDYANQGKAKASEGMQKVGKLVEENAAVIDEKLGVQYGNYARSAAATINDTATRLDEKSLEDLGEDVRNFVREKPALAVGIAAGVGYMFARLFRRH
jgi:ElaB/YqjD/DUF883 family membrane-anchored ribosome-binding protein